jgi:hypothetical protein
MLPIYRTISYMGVRVNVKVVNAIFNNILVISVRSVLLLEETGVRGENHCSTSTKLTPTCAISAYYHWSCEVESPSGEVYRVFNTTLYDKDCQWLAEDQWFSPRTPVSSSNKTDRTDITNILLKMALTTLTLTLTPI